MGKEFIEYYREDGRVPYSAHEICCCLTQYVRNYISEKRSIISKIDKVVRDAVLVDAINYLGTRVAFDFCLYTKDLYNGIDFEAVDSQCLLTVVQNFYAYYIFEHGIVESVLRNKHMNECKKEFDANDGAIILVDFINYIAEQNDYDKRFTIQDLYEKYKIQKHNSDMKKLKTFLELSGEYSENLSNGLDIDYLFNYMARKNDLKYVAEDGTYHYTDIIKNRVGHSEMYSWDAKKVDAELYAMAYAYAKMNNDSKDQPKTEIINKKIMEMKKR